VQRRYYKGRGERHSRDGRRIRRLQVGSFILAGIAGLLALLDSLSLLDLDGLRWLSSWYQSFTRALTSLKIDGDRGLVALARCCFSNLWLSRRLFSLLSLHERNARRYRNSYDNLSGISLDKARNDAANNQWDAVKEFVDTAQALISSEHQEWVRWRDWAPAPDAASRVHHVAQVAGHS